MPQPAPNHIHIDTGLEHMDGTGMSKHVRADVMAFGSGLGRAQIARMAADDLVDAKTRKRPAALRGKDRACR